MIHRCHHETRRVAPRRLRLRPCSPRQEACAVTLMVKPWLATAPPGSLLPGGPCRGHLAFVRTLGSAAHRSLQRRALETVCTLSDAPQWVGRKRRAPRARRRSRPVAAALGSHAGRCTLRLPTCTGARSEGASLEIKGRCPNQSNGRMHSP